MLLEIKDLTIEFKTDNGLVTAVNNISFSMDKEKLAIVGESGSGKTQSAKAILGLNGGKAKATKINLNGQNILNISEQEYRKIRGKKISMIMQDPKYSLNPILKIKTQMLECLDKKIPKKQAIAKCFEMLKAVNINEPDRVFELYPFEVSGGMGQRVMIALMLLNEPQLLIADEPTSSIDATSRLSVLNKMDELVKKNNMGLIFISHDLPLVRYFCDRIIVMYKGEIVEDIKSSQLDKAKHPYTKALLNCIPNPKLKGKKLATISDYLD